jgi:hypothetical protein
MNRRNFVAESMSAGLLVASTGGRICAAAAQQNLWCSVRECLSPAVARFSASSLRARGFRRYMPIGRPQRRAVGQASALAWRMADPRRDSAPHVFSGAASRPICLSGKSRGRSWFSTSRLQDRLEFEFLQRFSPAPTRWLIDVACRQARLFPQAHRIAGFQRRGEPFGKCRGPSIARRGKRSRNQRVKSGRSDRDQDEAENQSAHVTLLGA